MSALFCIFLDFPVVSLDDVLVDNKKTQPEVDSLLERNANISSFLDLEGWVFHVKSIPSHTSILLMEEILHQLIWKTSHDLQGFIHLRWCRISEPSTVWMDVLAA